MSEAGARRDDGSSGSAFEPASGPVLALESAIVDAYPSVKCDVPQPCSAYPRWFIPSRAVAGHDVSAKFLDWETKIIYYGMWAETI